MPLRVGEDVGARRLRLLGFVAPELARKAARCRLLEASSLIGRAHEVARLRYIEKTAPVPYARTRGTRSQIAAS